MTVRRSSLLEEDISTFQFIRIPSKCRQRRRATISVLVDKDNKSWQSSFKKNHFPDSPKNQDKTNFLFSTPDHNASTPIKSEPEMVDDGDFPEFLPVCAIPFREKPVYRENRINRISRSIP